MAAITNRVTGELWHHVRTRWVSFDSIEREYERQPFEVRRPADGQPPASGEAVCEACGETVPYRIISRHGTVLRRRIWLAALLTAIALTLTSFAMIFTGQGWWGFGFAISFGAIFGTSIARAVEDGVRTGRRRGTHRHYLRTGGW